MQQQNWFDKQFSDKIEKGTAEQILDELSKAPRLVKAVSDALAQSDENVRKHVMGPSRSQFVRKAIAEALQAAPD
jgi:hypothetical protein